MSADSYDRWIGLTPWNCDPDVHPSAMIYPGVKLGRGVKVFPYAVIGGPAEIRGEWVGEGAIEIGDRTVIRERVVIQGPTRIGGDCYIMDGSHIAHDCVIGHGATLSPHVSLAGHVSVGDRATVGMGALVHQHRTIGEGAMVGMGAVVTRDVPPWRLWYGNPARDHGPNTVGLDRWNGEQEDAMVAALREAYM